MALIALEPAASLGPVLPLRREARQEGYGFVERLFSEWEDGTCRFTRQGEVFLIARVDGTVTGFGGLCRDPFVHEPGLGRIRHVYVRADWRGVGIARAIVTALLDDAREHFAAVRLVTDNPAADALYRSLGFAARADVKQTHLLDF